MTTCTLNGVTSSSAPKTARQNSNRDLISIFIGDYIDLVLHEPETAFALPISDIEDEHRMRCMLGAEWQLLADSATTRCTAPAKSAPAGNAGWARPALGAVIL